jgi:hypothetical protein
MKDVLLADSWVELKAVMWAAGMALLRAANWAHTKAVQSVVSMVLMTAALTV